MSPPDWTMPRAELVTLGAIPPLCCRSLLNMPPASDAAILGAVRLVLATERWLAAQVAEVRRSRRPWRVRPGA